VRLFPEVHGTVLEALARVPCGSRSARVIHLLTIGLMCEHAYRTQRATPLAIRGPGSTRVSAAAAADLEAADFAFVSGLVDNPER
jgi:hypothetical protein